jgi:hypothetical protein
MVKGLEQLQAFDAAAKNCTEALAELIGVVTPLRTNNEKEMAEYKTDAAKWKEDTAALLAAAAGRSLKIICGAHGRNG